MAFDLVARLKQAGRGYRELGSNLLRGKWNTPITLTEEQRQTVPGRILNVVTRPGVVLAAPAAIAGAKVAAGATAIRTAVTGAGSLIRGVGGTLGKAATGFTKFLGSGAARQAVTTGLIGYTGFNVANLIRAEGAEGLLRGKDDVVVETEDEEGNTTKTTVYEPGKGGVVLQKDEEGNIYPLYAGGGSGSPEIRRDPQGNITVLPATAQQGGGIFGNVPNWVLPAGIAAFAVVLLAKKR